MKAVPAALLWTHEDGHDFTTTDIVLMLSIVLGLLLAHLVAFALGCLWAHRAGRGSPLAVGGWALVAAMESVYVGFGVADIFLWDDSYAFYFVPGLPLLVQIALYLRARDR